jgi:predicted molibdopterin-dependent oxidoreductase YjgC
MRIVHSDNTLPSVERGELLNVQVDGKRVEAFSGETIAAMLYANGIRIFRHTRKSKKPRGIYCGMGVCYDCLVTVDGVHNVRACVTPVKDGMRIETTAEITL